MFRMGHNLRWDSLDDYTKRDANIYARCYHCNRTATFDAHKLAAYFRSRGWGLGIVIVYGKLVCRRCRKPVGRVGPTRALGDTALPRR